MEDTEFPIHVFPEDIDLIFKISNKYQTDLQDFPAHVFSKSCDFPNPGISQNEICQKLFNVFLVFFELSWCLQSSKQLVLGVMKTSKNPKIMKMLSFRNFLKVKSKSD